MEPVTVRNKTGHWACPGAKIHMPERTKSSSTSLAFLAIGTDPLTAIGFIHSRSGSDQQSCHPSRPTVMITGHVPAVYPSRRSTATSCRSTSTSAFLEAGERPSRTSQPHSRVKIR